MSNENLIDKNIKHKIIFFFMPETIVFGRPQRNDDIDLITLKSISPCFYWCSAHEFSDFDSDHRYLFQYQIYSIEGSQIIPSEISQKWYKNKNQIREEIISYIDEWQSHKRILMSPNEDSKEKNNSFNKEYYFFQFAQFVAQSILKLQPLYVQQASIVNFDILQKDFWKMIAQNRENVSYYETLKKVTKNKEKKVKTNKAKTKQNKKIKNAK